MSLKRDDSNPQGNSSVGLCVFPSKLLSPFSKQQMDLPLRICEWEFTLTDSGIPGSPCIEERPAAPNDRVPENVTEAT